MEVIVDANRVFIQVPLGGSVLVVGLRMGRRLVAQRRSASRHFSMCSGFSEAMKATRGRVRTPKAFAKQSGGRLSRFDTKCFGSEMGLRIAFRAPPLQDGRDHLSRLEQQLTATAPLSLHNSSKFLTFAKPQCGVGRGGGVGRAFGVG